MEYAAPTAPTPSSLAASNESAEEGARAKIANASPELAEAIAKGYEPHDIKLRGIFVFLAGLIATVIVVLAFIYFLLFGMINFQHSGELKVSPVTVVYPPQPQPLQPSVGHDVYDREDMLQMRNDTMAILNSAGITSTGRPHISISDAIDQVQVKLPTRPTTKP